MFIQNTHYDPAIGHAGDLDIGKLIFDPKSFRKSASQRTNACTGGMNQGAVDVEQQEPLLQ